MTSLRYDEIPAERLPILDYTGRLGDDGHIGVLAVALAEWAARDDSKADAYARRAANRAMDALDAALAGLYELRPGSSPRSAQPTTLTAARVDELLARSRGTDDRQAARPRPAGRRARARDPRHRPPAMAPAAPPTGCPRGLPRRAPPGTHEKPTGRTV